MLIEILWDSKFCKIISCIFRASSLFKFFWNTHTILKDTGIEIWQFAHFEALCLKSKSLFSLRSILQNFNFGWGLFYSITSDFFQTIAEHPGRRHSKFSSHHFDVDSHVIVFMLIEFALPLFLFYCCHNRFYPVPSGLLHLSCSELKCVIRNARQKSICLSDENWFPKCVVALYLKLEIVGA